MTKSEEIRLVTTMIAETQNELDKDRKDRLHLEGELTQLRTELNLLLIPSHFKTKVNRNLYGQK